MMTDKLRVLESMAKSTENSVIQWAAGEIARLREENAKIACRRWVVQCGCYGDATAVLDALRRVCPPLIIEWTDDDGVVSHVEQMQPLPPQPGGEVCE